MYYDLQIVSEDKKLTLLFLIVTGTKFVRNKKNKRLKNCSNFKNLKIKE